MGGIFETANPSMIGMFILSCLSFVRLKTACFRRPFTGRQFTGTGRRIDCERRDYPQTILLLTVAASLGCWVSYSGAMAGQYPHRTKLAISFARIIITRTPSFHKHGLSALLIGRFIVCQTLPTIAGLSGLNNARFQFFNWMMVCCRCDPDNSGLHARQNAGIL